MKGFFSTIFQLLKKSCVNQKRSEELQREAQPQPFLMPLNKSQKCPVNEVSAGKHATQLRLKEQDVFFFSWADH